MAIYSAKYAKELVVDSICLHESSSVAQTGIKIQAVLKGETRRRVFHISALLADGGREEIQELVASLRNKSKQPVAEGSTFPRERNDDVA